MMLGTDIRHVSGVCWKWFQGQRSKVKVIARLNALFRQKDRHQLTAVRPLCVRRKHRGLPIDGGCRGWL